MQLKPLLLCGTLVPLQAAFAAPISGSIPSTEPTLSVATPVADVTITGQVRDEKGEALPGVTVVIKGTTIGASTDAQGNFSLRVPEANANGTLLVSYVGYQAQEVPLSGRTTLNVALKPDAQALNEVVVVGYGTQKRSDVTGSVVSVPQDRLERLPVSNIAQALQGAVAGVQITAPSSVPGSQPNINIRGVRSITANTNPYVILDGVPFPGNFNDISPSDIASIEILKDASATAIYGTRGSNGVILVTTKRGKNGKAQIRYNGYAGIDKMNNTLRPMNGAEYAAKYRAFTIQRNINQDPVPNFGERANYDAGRETDWIDLISQNGYIQDHNVAVSGGTNDVKYYVSGDYFKQRGILQGYQFRRVSLRSNLDANLTPWLRIGTSAFYANSNDDGGRVDLALAQAASPYGTPFNPDGTYNIFPQFPELLYVNPLLGLTTDRTSRVNQLTGTGYAEVTPTFVKGLTYRLNASYSYRPYKSTSYVGRAANNLIGAAQILNDERHNYTIENILTYNKDIGKQHFDLTALYSAQENTYFTATTNGSNFINDEIGYNGIGSGGGIPTISSYDERRSLLSQMGRLNYSYDSRYLFTVTARRDGSSVFGANTDKYATFPSVALGWNVANEAFLKSVSAVNLLKLRASYGITGNEGINPYQTITGQSSLQYTYNGVSATGLRANRIGNSSLKWEQTGSLNLAVDFSVLDNRIGGTVEYYKAKTEDLLLNRNLPIVTGYGSILDNIGEVENRGIEVTLNTVNVKAGDFTWSTSANYTRNRNEVLALNGTDDIGNRRFIGKPLNAIYDYRLVGVWQVGEDPTGLDPGARPGDLKFADLDGNGVINSLDREYLGTQLPKYTGGITNTFEYKGLSLRVFFQTAQGILRNNPLLNRADFAGRINQPAAIGYWTVENPSNDRPSLVYTNPRGYGYPKDASYTRLKDITLSYTFGQSLLDRAKLGAVTAYVSGRNLYTWTDWLGWDPEQTYNAGTDTNNNNFPNVATYVFGLNLTLR
ncbi:TonB-dependent receptor [Hymenobacter sp. BT186]|uniref:TonB-dependent receptor n=1 Tax=Hymenobacter telluris TaxID=2816474 RepID=A0A939EY53_9BACT|nr:TonB-dependent receptor [Hymenobacter telluris]MBO0359196.1 TonB-dependent receptor [Hymenobacter telluris]MBW3375222.1 TonB-dependent receptor [Hymenobacter norwichensis]